MKRLHDEIARHSLFYWSIDYSRKFCSKENVSRLSKLVGYCHQTNHLPGCHRVCTQLHWCRSIQPILILKLNTGSWTFDSPNVCFREVSRTVAMRVRSANGRLGYTIAPVDSCNLTGVSCVLHEVTRREIRMFREIWICRELRSISIAKGSFLAFQAF